MQESIVFLLRVQCSRKESSRSLSHLLMSFLYTNETIRHTRTTTVAALQLKTVGASSLKKAPTGYSSTAPGQTYLNPR